MAKQTVFIDDLTGEAGAFPRTITFDGTTYEVDLTDSSFATMREILAKYLEVGRIVKSAAASTGKRSAPVRKPTQLQGSPATIRAWADANGFACPRRGRIPASVVDAYNLAMDMRRG